MIRQLLFDGDDGNVYQTQICNLPMPCDSRNICSGRVQRRNRPEFGGRR
jgi:hypothetical protein